VTGPFSNDKTHAALLAWVLSFLTAALSAHPLLQDGLEGTWDKDALDLTLRSTEEQAWLARGPLAPPAKSFRQAQRYVELHAEDLRQGLHLSLGGKPLDLKVVLLSKINAAQWGDEGSASGALYSVQAAVAPGLSGPLQISHTLLEGRRDPNGVPYAVGLAISLRHGASGKSFFGEAGPGETFSADPSVDAGRIWSGSGGFLRAGLWHIWQGWDHLLFVSALVLAALLWWDLFQWVFAFTLAHSLTLSLAVLGWIRLPASLVEPGIAVSIVAVAGLNLLSPARPALKHWRLLAAFGFGLIHGLGFAGGLLDAMQSLPAVKKSVAIASFSAGVELGHLSVVLPLFLALGWGRQRSPRFQTLSLRYGSAVIALAGLFYLGRALTLE
jgi:hydrogenase/urease accessory protein HupE